MKEFLAKYVDRDAFDALLSERLSRVDIPAALEAPVRDALIGVGKRLRPALCYIGAEIAGVEAKKADFCAEAIEAIHCYSLVHDDLECMDNDAFRHGKPSIHAKYGEDVAVLCGDALLNLAFEILLDGAVDDNTRKAARIIARKAGVSGMIGGQVEDVSGAVTDMRSLRSMYSKKTGELLAAALMSGAAVGGASDDELKMLQSFALSAGVAYQFRDDVLDVTSSSVVLGKDIGSDSDNGKITAVSFEGIDGTQAQMRQCFEEAKDAIAPLGRRAQPLFTLAALLEGRAY